VTGTPERGRAPYICSCGFEAEHGEAFVAHLEATGHEVDADLRDAAAFDALADALPDVLEMIRADPSIGTPVDPNDPDLPPAVRAWLDSLLRREREQEDPLKTTEDSGGVDQ
jgi:putative NADPH-quinone reductase